MLTVEENVRLSKVGPRTPMGNLLRRYWHPIAATAGTEKRPSTANSGAGREPCTLPHEQR